MVGLSSLISSHSPNCFLPLSEQQPAEIRPTSIEVAWPLTAGLGVRVLNHFPMPMTIPNVVSHFIGFSHHTTLTGCLTMIDLMRNQQMAKGDCWNLVSNFRFYMLIICHMTR
ncbi:hypothetical protein AVEN_128270-1 [Araneus ventricosus]|uniref:Uncharacterized protein n=1 Tax=Araneus ventricosus TaxID=182803 RepID=A0A4Y2FVL3_ARAVE|nr:hypothetical protein AVEN_128270-1 [Araneus ventricosus]